MLKNTTKAKLAEGQAVFGCFVRYAEPSLAEYVAMLGWDFLVFDGEHGALQPADMGDLCRAAELRGVTPLARVTTNQPDTILRFLDPGTHGVHVPWVNSPQAAEQAVQSVKYVPRGIRGLAGTRASDWGLAEPLGAYIERANRETMVVIQIETREAVDAIEEYVDIDGIDVASSARPICPSRLATRETSATPRWSRRWTGSPTSWSSPTRSSASMPVRAI